MPATILHLSDIQYGRHHVDGKNNKREPLYPDDDYSPQLKKLISDLDILKNQGVRPDCIVVTGDIAEWSLKSEYAEAETFLSGLADYLGIDRRFVVMVPGNHDINRKVCQASRLMADAEGEDFQPPFYPKFKFYEAFFNGFYESASFPEIIKPYQFTEENLFVNFYFPEKRIAFVGLNSCIDESECEPHFGNIGVEQLKRASDELNRFDPKRQLVRVAVMHHNFLKSSKGDPESLVDADELKPILLKEGFHLILHGHQHFPRQEVTGKGDQSIPILATGSAGLDCEVIPEVSRRYQVIRIEEPKVRVYRRRFDKVHIHDTGEGSWVPDLGADATGIYDEFSLPFTPAESLEQEKEGREPDIIPLEIPLFYTKWLKKRCQKMDIDQFRSHNRIIHVDLPEVFIPLFAQPPGEKNRRGEQPEMRGAEKAVDVETLMDRYPSLLIEGQAGSGKTTLLKHYCHTIVSDETGDRLPVLIFLKDLQALASEFNGLPGAAATAEKMLDRYFDHAGCGLNVPLVKAFCEAGKAVILLDGLDEADAGLRDLAAESFSDFQDWFENVRVVLTGRPHGMTGKALDLFGEYRISIQDLGQEQVAEFVHKWFCAVVEKGDSACTRTADDLLAEMRDHEDVNELKDTPLMLTAICMLYFDGGRLPGQRAELYAKFIDYLLHHRFPDEDDRINVQQFLMALAMKMHMVKSRTIERIPSENLLAETLGLNAAENRELLKKEFDRIEAHCGLMKTDNRRLQFWHLSFQAFLAARGLLSRVTENHFGAIEEYWGREWFHEMISLYIGYLSTTGNDGIANGIVKKVILANDGGAYSKWLLAARSMADIHKGWRNSEVAEKAVGRMFEVMASDAKPVVRAEAGEILGRLGDPRNLKKFISIEGGVYKFTDREVEIKPFEIGKYPVTNSWYKEFIEAGGYAHTEFWTPEGKKWLEYTKETVPRFWYETKWNRSNHPVVGVCWWEAMAFIAWLNQVDGDHEYFLPDENQWEAAAAGKSGREYPWGDWKENYCNSEEAEIKKTSAVGVFSNGDTPEGVSDLAGNVWEWSRTEYFKRKEADDFPFDREVQELYKKGKFNEYYKRYREKYKINPMLRGGSWYNNRLYARCANRYRDLPNVRNNDTGFRCARA